MKELSAKHKTKQDKLLDIQNDQLLTAFLNDSETGIAAQRIADKLAHLRRGDHLGRGAS